MPRNDYGSLVRPIQHSADMLGSHLMKMPQIRAQLRNEAIAQAQRGQVAEAQVEAHRASARKGNAEAANAEGQAIAAAELAKIMEEPGALTNTPSGGFAISGPALAKIIGKFPQLGAVANSVGSGQANLLKGNNAGFEAEVTRTATGQRNDATIAGAGRRNEYSVDQREFTNRTKPIVRPEGSTVVDPTTGDLLGGLGLHKLNPDQSLVGDVPGVELNRLAQGVPRPTPNATTPQADSNRQRFVGGILAQKAAGKITPENALIAIQSYDKRFGTKVAPAAPPAPGVQSLGAMGIQAPPHDNEGYPDGSDASAPVAPAIVPQKTIQPAAKTAAPGYKIGQRYKGGLIYTGGDINDPNNWQQAQ
jgi:hypothetical protein